jgi:hypothetical protein
MGFMAGYLEGTEGGEEVTKALSAAMKVFSTAISNGALATLQHLFLACNQIGDEEMRDFSTALESHAGPNPEPGAPMPTPASPVCLVLGRLPSPWPIRLWAPTGGTWGQQYARAGRRSQCVTHTQHRGRSDTLTPAQVPAGGKHAHTSKKSVACADTLGLPAAVSSEDPRICDFALPRRDSNQRPCAGSNFRLHR